MVKADHRRLEPERASRLLARLGGQRSWAIVALLALEVALFAAFARHFLTPGNLANVLLQSTELALISAGMTVLIVQGGIDISVGSMLGLAALVGARLQMAGLPAPLAVLGPLGVGLGAGALNGLLVTAVRIPPIVATLGTMSVWRAAIFLLLGGQILTGIPSFSPALERAALGPVPVVFGLALGVYGLAWYLLEQRFAGRSVYAIGNNERAAVLAGVRVPVVKLLSYTVMGLLTGAAAITYTMRVPTVETGIAQDYALVAIAAVVIGGASITGGSGSIWGTLLGVLFVAFLRNGLVVVGVPSIWEQAALGAVIILSVGVDRALRRRRALSWERRQSSWDPSSC
jgi:ribose/xylose/arabinose/galactoside ABC-type transport system permease subunit